MSREPADAGSSRVERGCGRESGRLQGCAPPKAGIKPRGSAPADSRLASKAKVWIAEPSDWRDPPNCQAKDTQC